MIKGAMCLVGQSGPWPNFHAVHYFSRLSIPLGSGRHAITHAPAAIPKRGMIVSFDEKTVVQSGGQPKEFTRQFTTSSTSHARKIRRHFTACLQLATHSRSQNPFTP